MGKGKPNKGGKANKKQRKGQTKNKDERQTPKKGESKVKRAEKGKPKANQGNSYQKSRERHSNKKGKGKHKKGGKGQRPGFQQSASHYTQQTARADTAQCAELGRVSCEQPQSPSGPSCRASICHL